MLPILPARSKILDALQITLIDTSMMVELVDEYGSEVHDIFVGNIDTVADYNIVEYFKVVGLDVFREGSPLERKIWIRYTKGKESYDYLYDVIKDLKDISCDIYSSTCIIGPVS